MPTVNITITGLHETMAALNTPIGELSMRIGDAVAQEAVLPRLREYPAASGRPQPFRSDKARRFFFAALRSGKIGVPYRRTNALAALWDVRNTSLSTTEVVSRRPKSDLIIGSRQAAYHKGTWKTVEMVAVEAMPDAAQIAERIAREYLDRAGLV